LEHGLAYLALAERNPGRRFQERAAEVFASVDRVDPEAVPDRIRFEIINHQANAAILLNDLDAFEFYLCRGVAGVSLLGSQQRRNELQHAWRRASEAWENEPRFKAIGQRLQVDTEATAFSIEAPTGRS
jgi:hypothetical protein